ncbi:helix-turn-helix domain-containing protein [Streptococcus lutetiensis]|uniref:helix-turn-helix domain-containing protein n=1 Tax=Streptococcus lutetiensis TaxID=150055 RepID=UPI001BD9CB7C|nr:helix-turn-helix transcriptional regulator [Streptococcus lutetiensis]MBT0933074.1 helix-turn-helix domain-containing protein [Streptococcus lutetiensis]
MNRLRELQRAEKLTQQELADIAEVSKRTIQNWEKGENNIKPEKAKKLADYFGVSIPYLLGYDDNDFEKQIRIDVLNNVLNKLYQTHDLLLETASKDFWKGYTAAVLIVQTQEIILEFEESANGK